MRADLLAFALERFNCGRGYSRRRPYVLAYLRVKPVACVRTVARAQAHGPAPVQLAITPNGFGHIAGEHRLDIAHARRREPPSLRQFVGDDVARFDVQARASFGIANEAVDHSVQDGQMVLCAAQVWVSRRLSGRRAAALVASGFSSFVRSGDSADRVALVAPPGSRDGGRRAPPRCVSRDAIADRAPPPRERLNAWGGPASVPTASQGGRACGSDGPGAAQAVSPGRRPHAGLASTIFCTDGPQAAAKALLDPAASTCASVTLCG